MKTTKILISLLALAVAGMSYAAQSASYYKSKGMNFSFRYYDKVAILDNVTSDAFDQPVLEIPSEVEYEGETYTVQIINNVRGSVPECVCQKVIVPNTVTQIAAKAFQMNQGIKEVVLPKGLTCINDRMFSLASGLETLVIPESCTRLGAYVFNGCANLRKIVFPASVTNLGNHTFTDCGVEEIVIKGNITVIGEGNFKRATRLKTVNIPSSVQKIGRYAFAECIRLTFDTLRIPAAVTLIDEGTFRNCQCLTIVELPGVTTINYDAFSGCASLRSLTLGANITRVSYDALDGCKNLTDIYCYAPYAPDMTTALEWHASWAGPKDLTIHVPKGCAKYWKKSKWNSFNIVEMEEIRPEVTESIKQKIEEYLGIFDSNASVDKNFGFLASAGRAVYNQKLSSGNAQDLLDYFHCLNFILTNRDTVLSPLGKELKKAKTVEAQEEVLAKYGNQ